MFVICFISQWTKRSKHDLFVFPLKKTLIWRRHCSIGQSCCTVTSKRSISLFLESSSGMKFGSVRYINQSNRSISVRLFALSAYLSRFTYDTLSFCSFPGLLVHLSFRGRMGENPENDRILPVSKSFDQLDFECI